MRTLTVLLLFGTTSSAVWLKAQEQTIPKTPKHEVQFVNTEDGGVSETLQSIVVPPKAGAPFTLTLETEWVKTLYDGGTVTFVNKRRIARDALE